MYCTHPQCQEHRHSGTENCFLLSIGNLGLYGEDIEVDWLKLDMKQKLRSERTFLGSLQPGGCNSGNPSQASGDPVVRPLPQALCVLDYLNALCEKQRLGTPVFLTKCVQLNPDGWVRFWYQVVIPGYPSPFSGFMWIKTDKSGLSGHDKAKNAIALQLLKTLGESLHGFSGVLRLRGIDGTRSQLPGH